MKKKRESDKVLFVTPSSMYISLFAFFYCFKETFLCFLLRRMWTEKNSIFVHVLWLNVHCADLLDRNFDRHFMRSLILYCKYDRFIFITNQYVFSLFSVLLNENRKICWNALSPTMSLTKQLFHPKIRNVSKTLSNPFHSSKLMVCVF